MRIPFSVWLFSKMQATIRGKAKAEPFNVCANCILPSAFLKRTFKRFDWNVSKLDTEDTSNQRSCAAEYTSISYVSAEVKLISPPHKRNTRYGNSNFCNKPCTYWLISSNTSYDLSGCTICTASTLSNW